ncbi:hypothetical protein [Rhizomonospora bruguierae]|uniref:hypothetical protein n=1 Tax=Rhizomonospora bruguierae TaxID=1581705 RepID=UPI001BCF22A8|nr:hypothetical protein [Micromonospora sp. NBRC 107566]
MPEGTETEPQVTEPTPPEGGEPKTFDAEYVEKLRKENARYRTEAKANAEAAKRLGEIEEANKTTEQKAAEKLAAAEKAAADAQAAVLRRDVALEHKLGKDDAALLDTILDETAMRALAARLGADGKKKGNYVPREGNKTKTAGTGASDEREFVRELFGSGG